MDLSLELRPYGNGWKNDCKGATVIRGMEVRVTFMGKNKEWLRKTE
jgi:hypothetical protein